MSRLFVGLEEFLADASLEFLDRCARRGATQIELGIDGSKCRLLLVVLVLDIADDLLDEGSRWSRALVRAAILPSTMSAM